MSADILNGSQDVVHYSDARSNQDHSNYMPSHSHNYVDPTATDLALAQLAEQVNHAAAAAAAARESSVPSESESLRSSDMHQSHQQQLRQQPTRVTRGRGASVALRNLTQEERKARRLQKNGLAAKECRKKKKLYLRQLEDKCAHLEEENIRLMNHIDELNGKVSQLPPEDCEMRLARPQSPRLRMQISRQQPGESNGPSLSQCTPESLSAAAAAIAAAAGLNINSLGAQLAAVAAGHGGSLADLHNELQQLVADVDVNAATGYGSIVGHDGQDMGHGSVQDGDDALENVDDVLELAEPKVT